MALKSSLMGFLVSAKKLIASDSGTFANTTLSEDISFEIEISGETVRLYDCKVTNDPVLPDSFSGRYKERYLTSSLCLLSDVLARQQVILNDINNQRNIIYSIGIKREDPSNPTVNTADFDTSIQFTDLPENNEFSLNLFVDSVSCFNAFSDKTPSSEINYLILNDPGENTQLILDENIATINSNDIVLKKTTNINQTNFFTIFYRANGTVEKLEIVELLVDGGTGTRTWNFPVSLPDASFEKVDIKLTGVAASGISASVASFIQGSLTTTSIDFNVFDGLVFGDDNVYAKITWYDKAVL